MNFCGEASGKFSENIEKYINSKRSGLTSLFESPVGVFEGTSYLLHDMKELVWSTKPNTL